MAFSAIGFYLFNNVFSVGVVEGGEAGVEPVEEGLLEESLPEEVNDDAHEVDAGA